MDGGKGLRLLGLYFKMVFVNRVKDGWKNW